MLRFIAHTLTSLRTLFAPRGRHRARSQPRNSHPHPTPEQRSRRRTLWLATYGIDLGPRVMHIHGMEVPR